MTPSANVKRSRGEDAAPARGHSRQHVPADYRSVNGWGADLDPKNRPSVPMEWPSNVSNVRGDVRAKQVPRQRVHMSNEHPDLTPVFGTSTPPRGLSGKLRDYAYEYGEGTNRHWMTLMLADRVDMIESLVTDAFRGKPDNIIREKGWKANVKHAGPPNKLLWLGVAAIAAVGVGVLLSAGNDRR